MTLLITSLSPIEQAQSLTKVLHRKHSIKSSVAKVLLIGIGAFLAGCSSTHTPATTAALNTDLTITASSGQRMDRLCIEQVQAQQAAITQPTLSQSLSLANTALHCVGDIQYSPAHEDVKTAMQFSALAFVNFVQAGDIAAAKKTLTYFRQTFPQQDLLFADFTSFVDTATVLVGQSDLTSYQLTALNINPTLRDEISRQRKWSLR